MMDDFCNKGNLVLEEEGEGLSDEEEDGEGDGDAKIPKREKMIERYDTDPKNPQPVWMQVQKTKQYKQLRDNINDAINRFWEDEQKLKPTEERGTALDQKNMRKAVWEKRIKNWIKERRRDMKAKWKRLGIPVPDVILTKGHPDHGKLKVGNDVFEPNCGITASDHILQNVDNAEAGMRRVSLSAEQEEEEGEEDDDPGQNEDSDEDEEDFDDDEGDDEDWNSPGQKRGSSQRKVQNKRGRQAEIEEEEEDMGNGQKRGGSSRLKRTKKN